MKRDPERCEFRHPSSGVGDRPEYACELVRRILGTPRQDAGRVSPEACRECCGFRLPSPSHLNPVIASLAYQGAKLIADDPCSTWRDREEAVRSTNYVIGHLELVRASGQAAGQQTDRPRANARSPQMAAQNRPRFRWAIGLLTAPRPIPTIDRALLSLAAGGFSSVHIFAEPGSWIPDQFAHLPRTVHGRPLGNLGNFYTSLASLLMLEPGADCYAIFQDDIEVAQGLRSWCDGEFWPEGSGLVSLYTCGVDYAQEPGWRILHRGMCHTFGAQAFVFGRDVLKEFLTDGRLLELREEGFRAGDDAALGEWATRRGIGIAYHTPSLVSHVGATSSIVADGHGTAGPLSVTRAVRSVGDVAAWRAPPKALGKVGLVGWNTASGLGYVNRDIAARLPIEKWLVPKHPAYPTLGPPRSHARVDAVRLELEVSQIKSWLRGLDWVLFVEFPYFPLLAHCARELGIPVACVPMWEFTDLRADWVRLADLMICPTRFTYDLLADWKRRFGFGWDLAYVPWPIETGRFRFRRRTRCERFLFVNGTGGRRAIRQDGSLTEYHRKGMETLIRAARMLRPIPLLIYSQIDLSMPIPDNVELRPPPAGNDALYRHADVCVQPSHWEGLGLALLECQAAGLPLVTTDAPPMNEYRPISAVGASRIELVSMLANHVISAHLVAPEDLAACLRSLYRTDISSASESARSFIEAEHSWEKALPLLIGALAR
jgi:glycosyltransferase involved in cell wall biosynthesis